MKTLTAMHGGKWTCTYRGKTLIVCSLMAMVEYWAHKNGYTHVKWVGIPLGKGTQTCKVAR